eukprot:TRINITY_DN5286_c0_g1_i6.p1 TRINITY_DN5286_c0_g1~~TRINITY_DN5286_c0_g1_i6.p1  ORF type:complete len:769 (+),score=128.18 TRINITY_DN5286_c0_g1_i6:398-2704(+)
MVRRATKSANNPDLFIKGPEGKIREMFLKVELSVSSYDTAWVAMVPSPDSPLLPCFPECLNWLLENQLPDGSWGLPRRHPSLIKDALSSTLACVLALKRWNVGEEQIRKGLHFIGSHFASTMDEKQCSPIGFEIIFPGMIEYGIDLGLGLPLSPTVVDTMLHKRDLEFKRGSGSNSEGRKAYLAYVAEGLGKLQDWEEVLKYQKKNGSLFNSPSTTAAALTHLHDPKCLAYLRLLLKTYGNAVPTTYPLDIYTHLRMVDSLERLGIARHFRNEIKRVLDDAYRRWHQNDEEIYVDVATCALAFRLLRMNGYEVSSDALAQYGEEDLFNLLGEHLQVMDTVLELYRASQIMTFPNELVLKKLNSWSSQFLKREIYIGAMHADGYHEDTALEVDYAIKFPYHANLDRLENRRNIEHYNVDDFQILKTSYRSRNIANKHFLDLAVEDFNLCQSIHRIELKLLERWVKECRLDQLKFARQKLLYCYFSGAATLISPEMSEARISWTKTGILTTVVDDFFDVGGSEEELINFIKLVEKWDGISSTDCCSEQVEILFFALYNTTNDLGAKASLLQGRSVIAQIIETWLALLKANMKEAEWVRNNSVPTMDEYMENGYISFALGPVIFPTIYLIGPKLSDEAARGPEFQNLYKFLSMCGRLLNDTQSYEREGKEGKLNSVSLRVLHSHGAITEEDAASESRGVIETNRRDLLKLVVQTKGSVLPRACKDLFWNISRVLHVLYLTSDGFSSPQQMMNAVNAVIHEPINPPSLDSAF